MSVCICILKEQRLPHYNHIKRVVVQEFSLWGNCCHLIYFTLLKKKETDRERHLHKKIENLIRKRGNVSPSFQYKMHIKLYSGVVYLNNLCTKYIIDRKKKITKKEIRISDLKPKEQTIKSILWILWKY